MPDAHAILAPSAAKRWLTCAPSARLEASLPERTSPYAEEGTVAHAVAESLLSFYKSTNQIAVYDDPWNHSDEFHRYDHDLDALAAQCLQKGFDWREILETVHDGYVALVWADYVRAKAEDPAAVLLVEQRVDLSDYVPESFGSSDAIIIWGRRMNVYDLKYGRGVRVDAVGNPQMRLYALGALLGPGETYGIETVRATIIQPRLHAVSSETLTDLELRIWANVTVAPAAKKAWAGDGEFVPGDHCEFCRARAQCFALLEYTRRIVRTDSEPKLMTADDIAAVLPTLSTIEGWAAAVRSRATEILSEGGSVPGWKLVEGRSTRKILREGEARQILRQAGFSPENYDKVELRGITDLTRLVGGAKTFNTLLGHLVEKQPGKPALAPEDDPRATYNPAASAENSFGSML